MPQNVHCHTAALHDNGSFPRKAFTVVISLIIAALSQLSLSFFPKMLSATFISLYMLCCSSSSGVDSCLLLDLPTQTLVGLVCLSDALLVKQTQAAKDHGWLHTPAAALVRPLYMNSQPWNPFCSISNSPLQLSARQSLSSSFLALFCPA